jgi:hypothetical protein
MSCVGVLVRVVEHCFFLSLSVGTSGTELPHTIDINAVAEHEPMNSSSADEASDSSCFAVF